MNHPDSQSNKIAFDSKEVTAPQVAPGYEAAHQEWLSQGAHDFKKPFRIGAPKQFYATNYWTLGRRATLERDGFKCCHCGKDATQVHHLSYEFMGEDHLHTDTLVSACPDCHGLLEYARNAQELAGNRIRRRIYSCQGFVEGRKGFEDETPVKVFSRLLAYREELTHMKRRYEAQIPYKGTMLGRGGQKKQGPWSTALSRHNERAEEARASMTKSREQAAVYTRLAEEVVNGWTGSEREKAARIVPLLEEEVKACQEFANGVVQPLPR